MPEVFVLNASETHPNRNQSPTFPNNDRYTPVPYENSNRSKPEVFHTGVKNDNQPFKPSSPMHHVPPTSHGKVEMYSLQSKDGENEIPDRRPSPALMNHNRVSPMPYQHPNGHGAEMYYIQVGGESNRRPPSTMNDHNHPTKSNDPMTHLDNHDQHKVTMYMLTTNAENLSPPTTRFQRTPSPPIRPAKKQQAVSYDTFDDPNKYETSKKQRQFPTSLQDVSSNIRYVPLSQSKASESIARSMNKYRWGDS